MPTSAAGAMAARQVLRASCRPFPKAPLHLAHPGRPQVRFLNAGEYHLLTREKLNTLINLYIDETIDLAQHRSGQGTIEPIHNAISLAGIVVEKRAKSLLLPVSCRRQLFDLSDDMATRLDIEFHQDAKGALLKALAD